MTPTLAWPAPTVRLRRNLTHTPRSRFPVGPRLIGQSALHDRGVTLVDTSGALRWSTFGLQLHVRA